MMAGLIFAFSLAALLQFFVSYCRSVIAASSKRALSPDVQDVIGITKKATGDDFERVMQFLHLCPERREDRNSIQAIGAYFRLLGVLRKTMGRFCLHCEPGPNLSAPTALISRRWRWTGELLIAGTCSQNK